MFWKWSQVQSWLQTEDCGVLDQIASVKMFFFSYQWSIRTWKKNTAYKMCFTFDYHYKINKLIPYPLIFDCWHKYMSLSLWKEKWWKKGLKFWELYHFNMSWRISITHICFQLFSILVCKQRQKHCMVSEEGDFKICLFHPKESSKFNVFLHIHCRDCILVFCLLTTHFIVKLKLDFESRWLQSTTLFLSLNSSSWSASIMQV